MNASTMMEVKMHTVAYTFAETSQAPLQRHFTIGQDPNGHWLAVETHRLGGGLFKTRADAVHFVEFETGHRPGAVEFSPTPLRLTF